MSILFFNISFRDGAKEPYNHGDVSGIQWVITDGAGIVKVKKEFAVEHNANIGPTRLLVKIAGTRLTAVMGMMESDMRDCDEVVAHDVRLQGGILRDAMMMLWDRMLTLRGFSCTLERGAALCKLLQPDQGFWWPSLQELHNLLFKSQDEINPKDSFAKVMAVKDCYFEIVKKEVSTRDVPAK